MTWNLWTKIIFLWEIYCIYLLILMCILRTPLTVPYMKNITWFYIFYIKFMPVFTKSYGSRRVEIRSHFFNHFLVRHVSFTMYRSPKLNTLLRFNWCLAPPNRKIMFPHSTLNITYINCGFGVFFFSSIQKKRKKKS